MTMTSACVLLPVPGKLFSQQVAFVVCTFRVLHDGLVAHVALPRVVANRKLHHQGHLACALGLG